MLMLMVALKMSNVMRGLMNRQGEGAAFTVVRTQHFITQWQLTARCELTAKLREKERCQCRLFANELSELS